VAGRNLGDEMLVALAAATISADQREEWRKKGYTLPDGSYPIPDTTYLKKAIQSYGRCPPSKRAALKAHIIKRAKALGVDVGNLKAGSDIWPNVGASAVALANGDSEDDDNDPKDLALALDAVIDQADSLMDGLGDTSNLPPDVQQILALIDAADTLSDELLDALGVPDPDEGSEVEASHVGLAFVSAAKKAGDEDAEKAEADKLKPEHRKKYDALRKKGLPHAMAIKACKQ
jgi:hypothetical protein